MAAHQNGSEANHSQSLKHGLKSRHLTMISIAGVIGGSLFVGSGSIIYNTSTVVFLTYALGTPSLVHHAYVRRDGSFKSRQWLFFNLCRPCDW